MIESWGLSQALLEVFGTVLWLACVEFSMGWEGRILRKLKYLDVGGQTHVVRRRHNNVVGRPCYNGFTMKQGGWTIVREQDGERERRDDIVRGQ